jgi:nicotinate-nucleotide adenylyltransferase
MIGILAVASPRQRVAMLTAAIENYPVFTVDDREFGRAGPSYTLDTLVSLREELAGAGLCLLIGMDAFRGLPTWHRWHELLDYCHIVIMTRPGARFPGQGELADFIHLHRVAGAEELTLHSSGRLLFHTVSQLEISATRIRELLAAGEDAGFLLPEQVIDVIRNENLYTRVM